MKKEEKMEIRRIAAENVAQIEEIRKLPLGILLDKLGDRLFEATDELDDDNEKIIDLLIECSRIRDVVVECLQKGLRDNLVERTSVNYRIDSLIDHLATEQQLFGRDSISVSSMQTRLIDLKSEMNYMV